MYKFKVALLQLSFMFVATTLLFANSPRYATLDGLNGSVEVRVKDSGWIMASSSTVLHEMDEIRTGINSSAIILLDADGKTGRLELREQSHIRLSTMHWREHASEKITFLDLAKGKVLAKVGKLEGESKFEVRTPNASAGVRGTIFEVSVDEQSGASSETSLI